MRMSSALSGRYGRFLVASGAVLIGGGEAREAGRGQKCRAPKRGGRGSSDPGQSRPGSAGNQKLQCRNKKKSCNADPRKPGSANMQGRLAATSGSQTR
eukprot:1191142-Pyramimonas_sp.AAC.1